MNTTEATGKIIFYYKHEDLFDDVQHQSAFMCKNTVSKDGVDLSERYAITDDEEPMFQLCLRETMPDIYDIVRPITHGINPAYYESITAAELQELIDEDDTPEPETESEPETATETEPLPSGNYVAVIVQNNGACNPNTIRVVDSALRSTLEQGVLANFYERVTHPEITKLAAQMYVAQTGALSQRIIPLRNKSVL